MERNFPYRIAWILFIGVMLVASGMMLSQDPTVRAWGLTLMMTPLALFGGVLALYYWKSRRSTQP